MPVKRFREWAAYYEIENETPTTTERILAHIASVVTNYAYRKKYKASDFLPQVKEEKGKFTKKQGSDLFQGLANLVNKAK